MTIYDVIMKLVGPITPAGETNTDEQRLINIKALTSIIALLVERIETISWRYKGRNEYSIKAIVKVCDDFLKEVNDTATNKED